MDKDLRAQRRSLVNGLLFVVGVSLFTLSGCASGPANAPISAQAPREPLYEKDGRLYVRWTEELQLSDGRVIIAERSDEYLRVSDPGSGWGRGGWLYRRGSMKAVLPAPISKTVGWEGTLQPLVLDVFPGPEVYFVGRVAAAGDFDEWKIPWHKVNADPSLAYVVFRMSASGWERVTLAELPQAAKPNLLASTRHFFERTKSLKPGSLIDLKRKKEIDSNPLLAKELRTIVRPSDGLSQ